MITIWENLFRQRGGDKIQTLLKGTIIFKDLSSKELSAVQKIMNIRQYKGGEEIFRQGDAGIGMYIIISGSVSIYLEEVLESQEIKRRFITKLVQGDFFGESALVVEGGRRSATGIAQEDTTLLSFFQPDLMEIININQSAGIKILLRLGEVLGVRLRETNKKILHLMTENDKLKSHANLENKSEYKDQTHTS